MLFTSSFFIHRTLNIITNKCTSSSMTIPGLTDKRVIHRQVHKLPKVTYQDNSKQKYRRKPLN